MPEILEVLLDSLLDSLKLLVFLFAAYLIIEYFEHKASEKMVGTLSKFGRFSPLVGAALGVIPQCGFSVSCANLYAGKLISLGTLAAVFISTSDEAIPVLLAYPEMYGYLWKLILIKVGVGIIAGFAIDLVLRPKVAEKEIEHAHDEMHEHCHHCCEHGIFRSALIHTLKSYAFILIFILLVNFAVYFIGEEKIATLVPSNIILQPIICALIGFIPNCAASLLLTQLFVEGAITFGSLTAGLITNAGIGFAVLFRASKRKAPCFALAGIMLVFAVLSGLLIQLF